MRWFTRHIARFKREEDGTVLVEFVIVAPIFVVIIAMGFEFFDAFKSYNRAHKASYAVADFVSRETDFNDEDVKIMHAFLDGLLPWMNTEKTLRVSLIQYQGGSYKVLCSEVNAGSGESELRNKHLTGDLLAKLPAIADGDTIFLTETRVPHRPLIDMFKLSDIIWENDIIVRPRFIKTVTCT